MNITLRQVQIPDFGAVAEPPPLSGRLYAERGHMADVMFLSGFEPRFEEALPLLGPGERRVLVTGDECMPYAVVSPLPGLEVRSSRTRSLLGRDRKKAPRPTDVLRDSGIGPGDGSAGNI